MQAQCQCRGFYGKQISVSSLPHAQASSSTPGPCYSFYREWEVHLKLPSHLPGISFCSVKEHNPSNSNQAPALYSQNSWLKPFKVSLLICGFSTIWVPTQHLKNVNVFWDGQRPFLAKNWKWLLEASRRSSEAHAPLWAWTPPRHNWRRFQSHLGGLLRAFLLSIQIIHFHESQFK